jgi:DNA-3-methyladenine glycosylase
MQNSDLSRAVLLRRAFYDRSPEIVARELLGKILVRAYEGEVLAGRITEVEAYLGLDDPASHTFHGKTARNSVLFGPPGHAYVYRIYGLHNCLNVSCLPDGEPGGVLFRAMAPLSGAETMARLRGLATGASAVQLAGGPARLCEALHISRAAENGVDMTSPDAPIRIVDDGFRPDTIRATPRIGIQKAADRPLRFLISLETAKQP